ncbi:cupin domain-containing protein [Micromonospora sp. NBC_01392]|uniref:cupin domain-containing protein n=1 Tax=Micromonospora sp. NBC_01392 TaxID=2903588 RepID=UPI00324A8AC5
MTRYKYPADAASHFTKHGVDLTVYGQVDPSMTVAHVSVTEGHFQEFYNSESTYVYYVISGCGTFYLDDKAIPVKTRDLVVVPPMTRIYYFGALELLLTVSPAFDEAKERHVRFLDKSQIPDTARS